MHDYKYSINNIIYTANQLGSNLVEDYTLRLDEYLANNKDLSREQKLIAEEAIDFLDMLISVQHADNLYEKGYEKGYEDARNEIRDFL